MSAMVKIVRGMNAGAEAALVDDIAVTLGKGDDCDIILADPTLPDAPLTIESRATGVFVDGERLEPFHVKEYGSAAIAVGPGDSAWGPLVWPKAEASSSEASPAAAKDGDGVAAEEAGKSADAEPKQQEEKRKKGGGFGCIAGIIVALLIFLLAVLALLWFFGDRAPERVRDRLPQWWGPGAQPGAAAAEAAPELTPRERLEALAAANGLELSEEENGRLRLSGNLATRAERLSVAAQAYAALPGIDVKLSDDESLKSAIEDIVSLLGEDALNVVAVTNSVAVFSGEAKDLRRTLAALAAELPRLTDVDVVKVRLSPGTQPADFADVQQEPTRTVAPAAARIAARAAASAEPPPVCGILTMPYPCIVLRNGQRILEGGTVNGWTVLKIDVDSISVSNSTGRAVWKP